MTTVGSDRSAADVLGLLSDETRIDVLRAIAVSQSENERPDSGRGELSFSEIYDRVDVDNTSKLSYHLGELTGTFLRKGDAGYSFTHAGERLVRTILAENYGRPPEFDPRPADGRCPMCRGTDLEATLDHQYFLVRCTDCERAVTGHSVTPAQVRTREGSELMESVRRSLALDYRKIRSGVCPECAGRLSTDVVEFEDVPLPDADPFVVRDRCEECLRAYAGPLSYGVAYHPASVAFHWDHGVDVTAKGMWEFHEHLHEGRWTAERIATDPDEYRVAFRHGDDALRCFLDADARVVRTERVRRETAVDRRS